MELNQKNSNDCSGVTCTSPLSLNVDNCQCECSTEGCANPNHILNSECECECPVGQPGSCPSGQVLLEDNCACGCTNTQSNCPDGATLNQDNCQCECPACTTPNYVHAQDSCQCECPHYTSGNCPGNQVLLSDNCGCGCRELEDSSNICSVDGQEWDSTDCQCKCTNVTECDSNKTFDHDSCTCECPVGQQGSCPGNQVLLADNCACGCSQASTECEDGASWDTELCSCTLINQTVSKGQTTFDLSGGDEYLHGTLTISDSGGSESHTITQLGSLIISDPGATRDFYNATISASPASASSQSDPHIKTFFDDSYQL